MQDPDPTQKDHTFWSSAFNFRVLGCFCICTKVFIVKSSLQASVSSVLCRSAEVGSNVVSGTVFRVVYSVPIADRFPVSARILEGVLQFFTEWE